jgi:NTP pyrophosphohydrolases including oxidative damage repair enzymes
MENRIKRINRELKYQAHRVKVYEDTMLTPNGETLYYDYVENRNGAAILLVDEEGKLVFVKQYRQALDGESVEIPGGCMEEGDVTTSVDILTKGEAPEDMEAFISCAKREAEEETGLIPEKLHFINYIVASVGLFSERTAVFIGTECKKGSVRRDFDEYMDVIRLTVDEALEYINNGKIHDAKTILAIYAYKSLYT